MAERDAEQLRRDVDRYRQAAHDALEQLDWCIGYFHGVGNGAIAASLARNRVDIRQRLMNKPAEPTPSNPAAYSG